MTKWLVCSVAAALLVAGSAGCGGNSGSAGSTPVAEGSPAAESPGEAASATPAGEASPAEGGDANRACLVGGSPWRVSTNDLASQMPRLMPTVNVTDVRITGGQTLTVDGDLNATFASDMVTKMTIAMDAGMTMVMTQTQKGTSTGHWVADGADLTSPDPWTGRLRVQTKVAINGRSTTSPVEAPGVSLAGVDMTYDCADGTLNMQIEGSPFSYLFLRAH